MTQYSGPIKITVLEPYYPGRSCPVCGDDDVLTPPGGGVWEMNYQIPDGWPLPTVIHWHTCRSCGMLYGEGDFTQETLNAYYRDYYGYGVDGPANVNRLERIAVDLIAAYPKNTRFVDFGGGAGIVEAKLKKAGWQDAHTVNVGETLPGEVDVLLASHVLEHVYDLPETMRAIASAVKPGGVLIIDGPDAFGLAQTWNDAAILDFNTKHINHFRLVDYLNLATRHGFEFTGMVDSTLEGRAAYRMTFVRGYNLADHCRELVTTRCAEKVEKLRALGDQPVNVWGLADLTWHLLSQVNLNVVNYIDNDPAYRGKTYAGKPVLERPDNDHPIVIMAQGQRQRLINNIRGMAIYNKVIEI